MTHVFQEGLLVGGGTRGQSDAGADIVERLQRFGAVLVPVLHGKCLSLVQEDLGIAQYDPVLVPEPLVTHVLSPSMRYLRR